MGRIEDVVERLEHCVEDDCMHCDGFTETECYIALVRDALDLLRAQQDRILELKAVREPRTNEWIGVKDRLPEERINPNTNDFEYVLCATTFGDVRAYKYGMIDGNTEAHFWHGFGMMDKYITHWMPLPEPPEGEKYDSACM